ncbi:hypothetical protein CHS0354_008534 [Potamilus streckersoni]|uniref:Uncharacterized protein n=1 Tax=Potamilus streckersoni TaxID=2493646 RepID=A0AAE0VR59_9BIVA|nr:hypothetical protein CHS0354_008534 [Potamilus streckersoni]
MGSGNSKPEAKPSPSKSKSESSPSKSKSETNHKEVQKEKVKSEAAEKVETPKQPKSDSSDNVRIHSNEEKQEKTQSHASVTKTPAKNIPPAKFKDSDSESSSDEEEDDIAAVLEATRKAKEEDERNKRNMRKPETEEYPETYAQKLQREQYLQQSLLRQKTFHKNPDEWKSDEIEVPDFDVSKFKAVNQQQQLQKQDIYGNPELRQQPGSDPDSYYSQPTTENKKALPRYDSNDEELMADIEKEFKL